MRRHAVLPCLLAGFALLTPGCGDSGTEPEENRPPSISNLSALPPAVPPQGSTRVTVVAGDPDQDALTYAWRSEVGSFGDSTSRITSWHAADSAGTFVLSVEVSDGRAAAAGSLAVVVGAASLTVETTPPEALISLNGLLQPFRSPHTFDPLAPGFYEVRVEHQDFTYAVSSMARDLVHGRADTLRFFAPTPTVSDFDLGRNDFLEIGGVAFLHTGLGIVYAGRTAAGTGIFSSAVNIPTGSASGIRILTGVRVDEPLAVNGELLVFVNDQDELMLARIVDADTDGLVDSVPAVHFLRSGVYSPSISDADTVAYSLTPAGDPAGAPVFRAGVADSVLGSQFLTTSTWGKLPSWRADGRALAFEWDGVVYTVGVVVGNLPTPDTLAATGFNTAPAWGGWGRSHLAWIGGGGPGQLDTVWLGVRGSPYRIAAPLGPSEPRFLAWSPAQPVLVVSENPGTGRVRRIAGLPLP